jgi:hypothetical protein
MSTGKRMPEEKRRAKVFDLILTDLKKFIRRDVGGSIPISQHADKLEAEMLSMTPRQKAEHAAAEVHKQIQGCQNRSYPSIDELRRRIDILETRWLSISADAKNGTDTPQKTYERFDQAIHELLLGEEAPVPA